MRSNLFRQISTNATLGFLLPSRQGHIFVVEVSEAFLRLLCAKKTNVAVDSNSITYTGVELQALLGGCEIALTNRHHHNKGESMKTKPEGVIHMEKFEHVLNKIIDAVSVELPQTEPNEMPLSCLKAIACLVAFDRISDLNNFSRDTSKYLYQLADEYCAIAGGAWREDSPQYPNFSPTKLLN